MKIKSLVPVLCIVVLLLGWVAIFAEDFECSRCNVGGRPCTDDWSCLGYNHGTCDDCTLRCFNGTEVEHDCTFPI